MIAHDRGAAEDAAEMRCFAELPGGTSRQGPGIAEPPSGSAA
ncbi:MAG: hypothetical protein ACRDR6_20310 [Pseudonocardiaceae bacterium]